MMNLYKRLILIQILIIEAAQLSITNLLLNNPLKYQTISDSYVKVNGQSLYVVHENQQSGHAQILQYSRNNQLLEYQLSLESETNFSIYWHIFNLESQIISFPIQLAENINIYQNSQLITTVLSRQIFFRAIWVKSKKLVFLSTVSGNIAYATKSQLSIGNFTYLSNSNHFGNTFLSLSPNQKYLCSTDIFTGLVSIWSIEKLRLFKQLWLNQSGIRSHSWSDNSNYLFVFGYQSGIIYKINSELNFIYDFHPSSIEITYSFYYYQTNQIIAISANTSQLIVINLNSFNSTFLSIGLENLSKMKVDSSKKYFTVFNSSQLGFFRIDSFCNSLQFFNTTSNICQSCAIGCQTCDQFYCYSCQSNYYLNQTNCVYVPISNTSTFSQFTSNLAKNTFLVINSTITVAGHRQFLNTFFKLFSNFDRFVLYIYHDRKYGPNMQMVLKEIHDTIDYRFQILSQDICNKYLGLDFSKLQEAVDYKQKYSLPTYINLQSSGQGFFQSNIQYFLLNIPLIIITLFAYRFAFRLLINYPFSIFFRRFSFWGILLLLLLEGNIQLFFFSFAGDFLTYFSLNHQHKFLNLATCIAAFTFLFLSTVGYLFLFIIYRKKSRYFYENCHGSYKAGMYYLIVNGVLSIIRGIIHRVAISEPQIQAIILFILELGEGCILILWSKRQKIFISPFVTSLFCIGNFSRALFNITFLMNSILSQALIDYFHIGIFILNVISFVISVIDNIIEVILTIKKMCLHNKITNIKVRRQKKKSKNIFQIKNTNEQSFKGSQVSIQIQNKAKQTSKGIIFKFSPKKMKNALNVITFKPKQQHKQLWQIINLR